VGLRDIARLASVDISTASRALNHDPRVNPERADQIRKLAERIGYRPRPLRSKLARSVGVIVSAAAGQPVNNFLERIAWLAQRSLADRRLHVNLERILRSYSGQLPAVVQQNRVDGVILGGHPPAELVAEIRALGMPAVAINDTIERLGISCVRSNPEPAMRQAILHLAARGHQAFALLATSLEFPTIRARHSSYEAALREIGIEPQPAWLVDGLAGEITGGRDGIRQLRSRGSLPTAILCENDWMALGAMQELKDQNLHIPQDVSIVGHDDLWICQQLEPQLTSIHRAEDELVSKAIDLLMEQIEGAGEPLPREVLVDGEMVWRQSAGPAPERLKDREPMAK
jgi:LacI family transcriptional regulator